MEHRPGVNGAACGDVTETRSTFCWTPFSRKSKPVFSPPRRLAPRVEGEYSRGAKQERRMPMPVADYATYCKMLDRAKENHFISPGHQCQFFHDGQRWFEGPGRERE